MPAIESAKALPEMILFGGMDVPEKIEVRNVVVCFVEAKKLESVWFLINR